MKREQVKLAKGRHQQVITIHGRNSNIAEKGKY